MQEAPSQVRELYDASGRATLTAALLRLFERWELSTGQQLALLGYHPDSRATLTRLRRGQPIANRRDLLDRAGHLLAIHKNLRLLYPRNPNTRYRWMTSRNRDFGRSSPVEIVQRYGLPGLAMVRAYLDRMRGS